MATVHSNFLGDLAEHHRDMLTAAGYPIAGVPLDECTELYVKVRSRTIEPAPRRVHEASGLQCPAGMEQAFEFFKLKVIGGDDLNPHLSRKLKKADYTDPLLTEWGIQHFHLSMTKDKRGFIVGQDVVLFGRVTPTDIYLAHFGKHDGGKGFVDVKIIEAIHKTWPETIAEFRIDNVGPYIHSKDDPRPLTPQEQAEFVRESNISAPVRMSDGTSYLINIRMMGGQGLAFQQAIANMWFRYKVLQEHARSTVEALVAESLADGTAIPDELRLKLFFDRDGNPYVQEQVTGTLVPIPEGWGAP